MSIDTFKSENSLLRKDDMVDGIKREVLRVDLVSAVKMRVSESSSSFAMSHPRC